jgi:hypothetical protein
MNYVNHSHVSLKILQCALFIFFNRAHRILRTGSILVEKIDPVFITIIPLLISAVLHTAILCPGVVLPTRVGRTASIFSLLHILLLHVFAILLVVMALQRYTTTAGFMSVLLASHFCLGVRPTQTDMVHAHGIVYGYFMSVAAYILPLVCWVLIPVFRVHELEALALIYIPETICFIFQYTLQFFTLFLHIAVVSACSLGGIRNMSEECRIA